MIPYLNEVLSVLRTTVVGDDSAGDADRLRIHVCRTVLSCAPGAVWRATVPRNASASTGNSHTNQSKSKE